MEEWINLRDEIYSQPAPKGFTGSTRDLDIDVWEYAAWIMGFVSRYLAGQKIDPAGIDIDEALNQRLEYCSAKLNELIAFKQKHDEVARRLIRELSGDSQT